METFQKQVEQKSDKELVEIYLNAQDYQENFMKVVGEEYSKRNISSDALKNILGQIQSEAWLKSDKKPGPGKHRNARRIALTFAAALIGYPFFIDYYNIPKTDILPLIISCLIAGFFVLIIVAIFVVGTGSDKTSD